MTVNSEEDIRKLFAAGKVVRGAFERMKQAARAGVSTAELDALGGQYLKHHGARSAPQLYYDFPGATCISVNTEAAHGIPGQRQLADGDMVNIDVSAELDGYVADMGESFVVGKGTPQQVQICYAVQAAVKAAIGKIRSGRSLNVIGKAVQKIADKFGYEIVQNLGSHGVGNSIHEEPSYVPLDNPSEKRRLDEGLVLTIEPFFSTGANWVEEQDDGWTLSVPEGDLVAQFEQTLIVTNRGALVVTA